MEITSKRKSIVRNFENHIATLTDHGDLKVLNWKQPGTSCFYVRYVFDGGNVYITGDLGEAVFCLTWKASIHSFNDIGLGYFHEKLKAYHEDKYDFSSKETIKRLREWLKQLKEEDITYDHEIMRELFEEARGCSDGEEWVEVIHEHSDFISELDRDYWEWMFEVGQVYPDRFQSYLIGLQMASKQLADKKED